MLVSLLVGIFGATVGALFAVFPKELILGIAGLALFGTIANGLTVAMSSDHQREAALITFLVTASGVSLLGIGAAFWGGLLGGTLALFVLRSRANVQTSSGGAINPEPLAGSPSSVQASLRQNKGSKTTER